MDASYHIQPSLFDDSDDTPRKPCNTCGERLPVTPEYFNRNCQMKDGFLNRCKSCAKKATPKPRPKEVLPEGMKRCSNPECRKVLPATLDYFPLRTDRPSGLRSECIECSRARSRRYVAIPEHRERQRQISHDTYWHDPKLGCKKQREQRIKHREKRLIAKRKRYREHRIEILAYANEYGRTHTEQRREWRRNNPLKLRAYSHNYRARKKSIPGTHTEAQIQEQLKRQHYRCYYAACGFSKFPRVKENGIWKYLFHVEHTYPVSRVVGSNIPANDMSYLVLACEHCNRSKNSKFPWEFPEGGRLL